MDERILHAWDVQTVNKVSKTSTLCDLCNRCRTAIVELVLRRLTPFTAAFPFLDSKLDPRAGDLI